METREVLTQTRELIADPERWVQGKFAADNAGITCNPSSLAAERWCVLGAMQRVIMPGGDTVIIEDHLNKCANDLFEVGAVQHVNDFHGHSAVIELLDYAIERSDGD